MIEEMPNGVRINTTFIPAVNLQIEGYPCWLPDMRVGEEGETWYPLYFEIMFETGDLWVVNQGDHPEEPDKIMIEIHKNWANTKDLDPTQTVYPNDWNEFLWMYTGTNGIMLVA